jgi:hypothetical protein
VPTRMGNKIGKNKSKRGIKIGSDTMLK